MQTSTFDISVKGEIDMHYAGLFAPADVAIERGRTRIRAADVDQAALHALLRQVAELGLVLVGVAMVDDPTSGDTSGLEA